MKKKNLFITVIALAVLCGACLMFFFKGSGDSDNGNTITIGAIMPLTGDAASYGISLKKGLEIAFEGSGIRVIYEDSKGESKTAVNSINKLIDLDKVKILIGDMFTNTTMAIMPIADKNNILLLSPTASSSEITKKSKTTFRLYPSEEEEGGKLYTFSQKKFYGKRGTIVVVNENAMQKVAGIINQNKDKQIIEYSKGMTDFTPIIQKVDKNAEVVFLIGYFDDNTRFIKQSIELKRKYSFIGLSTLYTPQLIATLGNIESPIYLSAPKLSLDKTNSLTMGFVQQFQSKYNIEPDIWAGYGYDAGKITLKIIEMAQKNGTNYISEMYNINNYDGVTGVTTINNDRSINKTMDIVKYADGKFSTTIYE